MVRRRMAVVSLPAVMFEEVQTRRALGECQFAHTPCRVAFFFFHLLWGNSRILRLQLHEA